MGAETVLCLETSALAGRISPDGFVAVDKSSAREFLSEGRYWFGPRDIVEHREDFRQLIPYVMLMHGDSVVVYQRTPKGGESRLHGLYSVGLGGHVGLRDAVVHDETLDANATIERAVHRELCEETDHAEVVGREVVGLIYDNHDAVSRVHLGVVEIWTLESPFAASSEPAVGECAMVPVADLGRYFDRMEGWSKLCVEYLRERLGV